MHWHALDVTAAHVARRYRNLSIATSSAHARARRLFRCTATPLYNTGHQWLCKSDLVGLETVIRYDVQSPLVRFCDSQTSFDMARSIDAWTFGYTVLRRLRGSWGAIVDVRRFSTTKARDDLGLSRSRLTLYCTYNFGIS